MALATGTVSPLVTSMPTERCRGIRVEQTMRVAMRSAPLPQLYQGSGSGVPREWLYMTTSPSSRAALDGIAAYGRHSELLALGFTQSVSEAGGFVAVVTAVGTQNRPLHGLASVRLRVEARPRPLNACAPWPRRRALPDGRVSGSVGHRQSVA